MAGRYADAIASTACSVCPAGTFMNASGASACLECGDNAISLPGSAACVCQAGFGFSVSHDGSMRCSPCAPGSYGDFQVYGLKVNTEFGGSISWRC